MLQKKSRQGTCAAMKGKAPVKRDKEKEKSAKEEIGKKKNLVENMLQASRGVCRNESEKGKRVRKGHPDLCTGTRRPRKETSEGASHRGGGKERLTNPGIEEPKVPSKGLQPGGGTGRAKRGGRGVVAEFTRSG